VGVGVVTSTDASINVGVGVDAVSDGVGVVSAYSGNVAARVGGLDAVMKDVGVSGCDITVLRGSGWDVGVTVAAQCPNL
jgi:hypothetical protein